MPTVVHLDTSRTWRGGQLQVFLLHRELLRMGVASRLLARAGGALHHRCGEAGLAVEPVSLMRPWYPPAVVAVCRRTRRAAIVHAHDSHAAALAAMVRAASRHPAIVCHRRVAYQPNGSLSDRRKYRHVDRWIAVSTEIAGALRRAGVADVRVVPSAVDVEDLRERPSDGTADRLRSEFGIEVDSPVVGLVGALTSQKGHEALIAAAPRILATAPNTVFLCVGEGPLRAALQRRVRRTGMGRSFRFTGFRRDVPALMGLCTAIVAPSLAGEGSCAVIKEAMALGVPVAASDLPGNIEVLDGAGLAFPVGDADSMADAVVMLLEDPAYRADLGARGRRQSARWRPGLMAAGVVAAYDGLGRRDVLAPEAV